MNAKTFVLYRFAISSLFLFVFLALLTPILTEANPKDRASGYGKMDQNKDGIITEKEFFLQAFVSFKKKDKDKDGAISLRDYTVGKERPLSSGKIDQITAQIARHDRDENGRVSKKEFYQITKERFLSMDANKDGYITKEDRAFRKQMSLNAKLAKQKQKKARAPMNDSMAFLVASPKRGFAPPRH